MSVETIRVRLTGNRPLLMHSGRLSDPLDDITRDLAKITGKRGKTAADHEEIARIEWYGGLWLSEGRPCIPAEAVEASFIAAARARKKAKQARAGLMVMAPCPLDYEGPRDIDKLWQDPAFRLRRSVRVGNARTIRTRAHFAAWRVDALVSFVPTLLDRAEILDIFAIAGSQEGIGDWRPKYGRFTVESIE
ncbi:MAG TPA: hypothetical protein VFB31_14775 [Pseudolabrys sp.]|nr:hypothetical protein [Pseudolabrys sp.]